MTFDLVIHNNQPFVATINEFLTQEECKHMITT